jgi:hypothetical protein
MPLKKKQISKDSMGLLQYIYLKVGNGSFIEGLSE